MRGTHPACAKSATAGLRPCTVARGALLAGAAVAATLVTASSALAATTSYAIGRSLCAKPKPGHAQCLAMRRITVKKGTPGARPFKPGAGATGGVNAALAKGATPAATIGPAGGITPSDLSKAYGFNSLKSASSQTVAVVDAFDDPTIESDLQVFDSQYGLKTCTTANGCFKKVNQNGAASPLPPTNTGWAGEIALDVESVHAVCQTCKILLVEANTNSFLNLETATNEAATLNATEITNSYGGAGTPGSADLAAYNHRGIVVTVSTGDHGYFDYDNYALGSSGTGPGLPEFPAAANTVVAVGGTSLYLGQDGSRQSEAVWNDNGPKDYWEQQFFAALGATGGGCSKTIAAKPWQTALSVWPSTACGTHRLEADISSDADYLTGIDTYDTTGNSGWSTIGGTSFASPTVAAEFALAGGARGVAYPALTLYGHQDPSSVYDVTVGGNGYCGGIGAAQCGNPNSFGFGVLDCDYRATGSSPAAGDRACDALPGYDGPTGVGTPTNLTAFAKTGPKVTISGPSTVAHGTLGTWTATVTDPFPGGQPTTYTFNWGDGTPNTVVSSTALTSSQSHTYAAAGSDAITVTVKDNYTLSGSNTFPVTVS